MPLALSSWWKPWLWRSSHESGTINHDCLLLHWSLNCFPPLFSTWANSQRFLMTCQAISGIIFPCILPFWTAGQSIREIREVFCVVYGEKPIKFAIWSNYNDWSTNQCHVLYFLINLKNCMNSSVNVYTVRDVRMYLHSTPSSANLEIMLWMIYIVWVCFFTKFEPNISHGFEKIIKYFIAFVNSWEGWAWSCNYI